jgi:NADH-quinone oxidoreductase subunit N
MMTFLQQADAAAAAPEILLAVLSMVLLMLGVFSRREAYGTVATGAVIALSVAAAMVIWGTGEGKVTAFGGSFVVDSFARLMKVLALSGSAIAIILSGRFLGRVNMAKFEYPVIILLASVGMMMMISANDLISLYMGLELQSLALYVVAAINRDDAKSSEAGLKYFVLGALSSGMLLYGASLVYGFTGTTQFAGIASVLAGLGQQPRHPLRSCVHHRRSCLQGLGRAVPHVDAGRL